MWTSPAAVRPLYLGVLCGLMLSASHAFGQGIPAPRQAPQVEGARVPPQFQVTAGIGQTDNLHRNASEDRSDIRTVGVRFGAQMQRRRLEGDVRAGLEHLRYSVPIADDDEVLGSFDGFVNLKVVPDRFVWTFQQNYGQTRVDPLAAVSLDNRQRTTVFSTGPQFNAPVGDRNEVQLRALVSDRSFDASDQFDSRLTDMRAAFVHSLSSVSRLSLSFEQNEVDFDYTDQSYEFDLISVAYDRRFSSGGVQLTVGRGEVDIGGQGDSSTLARFQWTRDVGSRSQLALWAGRELTDAGELFRFDSARGVGDSLSGFASIIDVNDDRLRDIVISPSPLRRSDAGVRFAVDGQRTSMAVSFRAAEDRFELDPSLDNDFTGVQFHVTRVLNRRWSADLAVITSRQEFVVDERDFSDTSSRLTLARNFSRGLSLGASYERTNRDSDIDGFDENMYFITLGYALSQ